MHNREFLVIGCAHWGLRPNLPGSFALIELIEALLVLECVPMRSEARASVVGGAPSLSGARTVAPTLVAGIDVPKDLVPENEKASHKSKYLCH